MKILAAITAILLTSNAFAQNIPLPHGMLYGTKPDTIAMLPANNMETFMGKRTRTNATIKGKVLKVIQPKGGWFIIDAGNGKVIRAHFKNYAVNLPADLEGKVVIVEGIAAKQFIADDLQHFAGDSVIKKKKTG